MKNKLQCKIQVLKSHLIIYHYLKKIKTTMYDLINYCKTLVLSSKVVEACKTLYEDLKYDPLVVLSHT